MCNSDAYQVQWLTLLHISNSLPQHCFLLGFMLLYHTHSHGLFPPWSAAPGVSELLECWWTVPPQHHTHQRPLLLSYCSAASGRKSLPASSFSVKNCCYNGIISKFADSCFKYSLTFLLHRITPFVTQRCCLNSFLKWASACKADAVLFIFPLVEWKWSKRCQQLEGCWVYFCRIGFRQFTCLAAFCKILSYVLIAASFSSFFKGKIMLFREALG